MGLPSAFWWFIPVLGIAIAATSGRVAAWPDPEPAATRLTVILTSGDTLCAACVEPAGLGMVRITEPGGRYEFRAANRVRSVLDGAARDRTSDALDRGRVIGVRPVETFPEERAPAAPKPVRYGPRSVVRSFAITETSAFARVDKDPGRDERSYAFSFDLGREINVTERDAFGATVFLGAGNGSGDLGARLHYRRWLGLHSSLDFAPGLILAHE